ncbi:iron-containing redox enzyme family protein [Kitasatospora sp. NPDC059599]|uniref:iron-containing redox enzyme family protein n=1 Tax=Kitasatospora sp. NPDC059599 TaxID=3346880 RepID=UPI0036B33A4A
MHDGTTGSGAASVFRRLYVRAADPEVAVPGGELIGVLRAELLRASTGDGPPLDGLLRASTGDGPPLDGLLRTAAAWSSAAAERFRAVGGGTDGDTRRLLVRRAVLGWAPLGLAAGAWLQWLTAPGTADAPLSLRILALHASDVGVGHPGAARSSAYLSLLRQLRVSENAVPYARVAGDRRIADAAFRLPALLLLMSRRPDEFREELVGADLCLRAVGFPPPLALARAELQADWAAIDYAGAGGHPGSGDGDPSGAGEGAPSAVERCRAVADALVQAGPDPAGRVRAGFGWALATVAGQVEALYEELRASLDPGFAMAELMRLRAREGSVYHHQVLLEGRSLSEWLKDCRDDPGPFLDVLARSRLVKPGRSGASPLVTDLVGEHGPMFRVFSPDDLLVIGRWVDALAGPAPGNTAVPAPGAGMPARPVRRPADQPALPDLPDLPRLLEAGAPSGGGPRDLREAYHALMVRTGGPDLDDWCLRYVRGWLARARHRMDARSVPLPGRWTADGLRPWLLAQHDRHGAQFEEGADAPLPSREAVVEDAVQTAPLTLIDGSWLQGFTDHALASSDVGHSLFATYWDELGNGEAALNHPLIYRQVLKEMDVELPPTASPEFARWPGFRDASFELPVYWLCIGRFPCTFLPEVLGLNLAMELSGVGGSYRRAGMALRAYGFSTRFVDVHNTIDNVATGHSAWAADAVDAFMAGLPDRPGPGSRAEAWERVRAGYRSLDPPGGFLARRAARRGRLAGSRWRSAGAVAPQTEEHTGV